MFPFLFWRQVVFAVISWFGLVRSLWYLLSNWFLSIQSGLYHAFLCLWLLRRFLVKVRHSHNLILWVNWFSFFISNSHDLPEEIIVLLVTLMSRIQLRLDWLTVWKYRWLVLASSIPFHPELSPRLLAHLEEDGLSFVWGIVTTYSVKITFASQSMNLITSSFVKSIIVAVLLITHLFSSIEESKLL